MTLKALILASTTGLFIAVPDTYTGPTTDVDTATLPEGARILDTAQPAVDLAVRLVSGFDGAAVAIMGNEVAVNVGEKAVGVDPTVLVATGTTLRTQLIAAGAPDNYVDSPRNFGGPTILSYLTDATDDLKTFVTQLCNGNSDYNDAYLGTVPPDRRTLGIGNDGLYSVLSDADASAAAHAAAASRVDGLIDQTPGALHKYIDSAAATSDMLLTENGGRGGLLAFDGVEHKVTITDSAGTVTDYYVYRQG